MSYIDVFHIDNAELFNLTYSNIYNYYWKKIMENKKEDKLMINESARESLFSKKNFPWKYVIIGAISLIIIISIIILIIIFLNKSNSDDSSSDEKIETGIISCIYDISSDVIETKILGDNFNELNSLNAIIYVDNKTIDFSKLYKDIKTSSDYFFN